MDMLPSHLELFSEVTFIPPVLFYSPNNLVDVFSDAQIIGKNPIALTRQGELIQEALFRTRDRNKPAITYLHPHELRALVSFPKSKATYLSGKFCLLSSFWDNFGHWIPEHLLKVRSLIQAGIDISQVKFFIRPPLEG
jgi:hypothetical protein